MSDEYILFQHRGDLNKTGKESSVTLDSFQDDTNLETETGKDATVAWDVAPLKGEGVGMPKKKSKKVIPMRLHMRGTLSTFPAAARKPDADPILHTKVVACPCNALSPQCFIPNALSLHSRVLCIVLCLVCLLANTTKGPSVHTTEVFVNLSLLLAAAAVSPPWAACRLVLLIFPKFSKILVLRTWENTSFVKVHYLHDFLTQYVIYLFACFSVFAHPQMRSSEPVFPQRSLAQLREMTGRSDRPVVSPGGGGGGRWIPPPSGTWLSW